MEWASFGMIESWNGKKCLHRWPQIRLGCCLWWQAWPNHCELRNSDRSWWPAQGKWAPLEMDLENVLSKSQREMSHMLSSGLLFWISWISSRNFPASLMVVVVRAKEHGSNGKERKARAAAGIWALSSGAWGTPMLLLFQDPRKTWWEKYCSQRH